jgi:UDP-GlcNAc:undecaprenyl-phosphate/decaprenyl-phosphate GlcNAc-1-phosphate transferase
MYSEISLFVPVFCAALTFVLCLFAKTICEKLGILDEPDARKLHPEATPLLGGVTLLFAVLPSVIIFTILKLEGEWNYHLLLWCAALAVMSLVGIADDRHTISARKRLFLSFLMFGAAASFDSIFMVRILHFARPSFEFGLGTDWMAATFTMVCCVGLVNAINMADGKNGLVIGLCLGWLTILAMRAPPTLLPVFLVLIAAWFVLIIFNLTGRLFLGDGGTYGMATAIGLLAIATYNTYGSSGSRLITADELMVLFAVPVLDSFRLSYKRIRQGRSPMSADRDHLHHHLQRRFGWPAGLIIYWLIALVPPAIYFTLPR